MTMTSIVMTSPLGPLGASAACGKITALHWGPGTLTDVALIDALRAELTAYFAGTLTVFTIPLAINGTAFQQRFLRALAAIPYGQTRSYGDLAVELGASPQAVGQACGANSLPILIPCHRVLGAASLGGFSGPGGVEDKVALLRLEGAAGLLI